MRKEDAILNEKRKSKSKGNYRKGVEMVRILTDEGRERLARKKYS